LCMQQKDEPAFPVISSLCCKKKKQPPYPGKPLFHIFLL